MTSCVHGVVWCWQVFVHQNIFYSRSFDWLDYSCDQPRWAAVPRDLVIEQEQSPLGDTPYTRANNDLQVPGLHCPFPLSRRCHHNRMCVRVRVLGQMRVCSVWCVCAYTCVFLCVRERRFYLPKQILAAADVCASLRDV